MGYNYRDVVTGTVYAPSAEAPVEYFQEWARFEPTDDPVTPIEAPAAEEAPADPAGAARKGGKATSE